MNKENPEWQSFESSELPDGIPSVDVAWHDMRQRLEDEMPSGGIVKPFYHRRFFSSNRLLKGAVAILLLLVLGWFISMHSGILPGKKIVRSSNNSAPVEYNKADVTTLQHTGKDDKTSITTDEQNKDADNFSDTGNDMDTNDSREELLSLKVKESIPSAKAKKNIARIPGKLTKTVYLNRKLTNKKDSPPFAAIAKENKNAISPYQPAENFNQQKDATIDISATPGKNDKVQSDITKKIADSLENVPEPLIGESIQIIVRGGLQWNLQVPAGSRNYFGGPSATSEPYRILIPGIWATVQVEKSIFSIEVNPVFSQHLPGKAFTTSSTMRNNGDTVITTNELLVANRVFGTGINLGYSNNVLQNWWAGGSIEADWWRNALISSSVTEEKRAGSSPVVVASDSYTKSRKIAENEWEKLSKFLMKINAELFYRKKNWTAGVRVGVPVMPFSNSGGPQSPLDIRLIAQLPLLKYSERRQ